MLKESKEKRIAADYIYERHALREMLENGERDQVQSEYLELEKPRCIYTINDMEFVTLVDHQLGRMKRVRQQLAKLQVNFGKNKGLWFPVVADARKNDYQVNITWAKAWSTRKISYDRLRNEIIAPSDASQWTNFSALDPKATPELTVCRESGVHVRIAVRGQRRGNSDRPELYERDQFNFHEFMVVVGDVPVNLPISRARRQRRDAWRGKLQPLFTYQDHRDDTWLVYDPQAIESWNEI